MKGTWTITLWALLASSPALAENAVTLTLSNHRFSPPEVHVRAKEPTTVILINADDDRVEFASSSLKAKRAISGRSQGAMRWRPLAPGRYPFIEEFHAATARGVVIVE